MGQEYIRQVTAAAELGISKQLLLNWINLGKVRSTDVGGIRMITRKELDRFKKTRNGGNSKHSTRQRGTRG